ncbi:unnamed protein product [Ophioblennius macclurei]
MEECQDFSLCGKAVVEEANLRDGRYWKLIADFVGPQSGEGLELDGASCKNRLLIQVGLLREDNSFPWVAIVDWLGKIFPQRRTADFRTMIERGIVTTLSLGSNASEVFLESDVNFNFVGPICDSIGVERKHLLELRDFSERAQSVEITNGLVLELNNFVTRERLAPIIIIAWLKNFNKNFGIKDNVQKTYKILRSKIKKLKICVRSLETRSHRRNAEMERLLQTPFQLVPNRTPKPFVKKRARRDEEDIEQVTIKEETGTFEIMQSEKPETGGEDATRKEQTRDGNCADSTSKKADKRLFSRVEATTLLDIAMSSIQKLTNMYGEENEACNQLFLNLLKNQYALTCKEHPAMAEFEQKIDLLDGNVPLASPVNFLSYNAHFLVAVHNAVEEQIMNFESEIIMSTGEKLGRDKLPKFENFVNMKESATSRYIHMACEILSSHAPDRNTYRKHWLAFCKEMKNPSRLVANQSDRLSSYFEAAAGIIHHHQEIVPFFSDLISLENEKCANIILESVAADAADSVIQSLVCVLAIIYCKILGPYWQLLRSGGEYSLFSQYVLSLYQKFLDWSKDPSTLLQPDESANVFQQYPLQQKIFGGIFNFCSKWHTNTDLIRACLKRTVKVIAGVTKEHLSNFLPGGTFGQAPSAEVSQQLVSCTFAVLMADYPCSDQNPTNRLSDNSCHDDDGLSVQSDHSSDDVSSQNGRNKRKLNGGKRIGRPPDEAPVECMDRDYIVATVTANGGPCKSQQDLDKMMLRFDGMSRAQKRESMRCELLYHKMILNNSSPHLDSPYLFTTQMVMKLKFVLPRVKPSYSVVFEPKRPRKYRKVLQSGDLSTGQSESSST